MKKLLLALLLTCMGAYADVTNPDFVYTFDRLPNVPAARKYKLGVKIKEAHTTAICVYDVAAVGVIGNAAGQVPLLSTDLVTPCLLPGKAVIRNGMLDITTALGSTGNAKLSISSGKAPGDLFSTAVMATFTTGQLLVSPVFATVSTYIKLPNANTIVNGVNTNPYQPYVSLVTASPNVGHFRLFIDYVTSE